MSCIDTICVVIPALNPPVTFKQTITGLIEAGFCDIIVIDDGSNEASASLFNEIDKLPECTVLTHPENMGKGAALKTAFSFIIESRPNSPGAVTMDGDGQHLSSDVLKCANAMLQFDNAVVMGVRDFHHPDVPKRNSMGNRLTAFAFRTLFGIKLRDTQTGLRGIPAQHLPLMLEIPGTRFEYETNMLLEIEQRRIPFNEVEITTVYEDDSNDRSHFRPFVDSMIIITRIIKYAMSSVLSFLVDIGVFWLALLAFGDFFGMWSIPACTAIARIFSSFFNFNINRLLVFRRVKAYSSHLWRYYTLAVVQMTASAGVLWLLAQIFSGADSVGLLTVLKMLVDTTLFFLSYHIQRSWVFKS